MTDETLVLADRSGIWMRSREETFDPEPLRWIFPDGEDESEESKDLREFLGFPRKGKIVGWKGEEVE